MSKKDKLPTMDSISIKEFKKKRMAEVRAYVRNFMRGKNPDKVDHLGQVPCNMDDAVRFIIVLQDNLEEEKARHQKASDHVHELTQLMAGVAELEQERCVQISFEMAQRAREIGDLKSIVASQQEEITKLRKTICDANSNKAELYDKTLSLRSRLDAALLTIKTLMER